MSYGCRFPAMIVSTSLRLAPTYGWSHRTVWCRRTGARSGARDRWAKPLPTFPSDLSTLRPGRTPTMPQLLFVRHFCLRLSRKLVSSDGIWGVFGWSGWAQTAGYGRVPNEKMPNTFTAIALDLTDNTSREDFFSYTLPLLPFALTSKESTHNCCGLGSVWIGAHSRQDDRGRAPRSRGYQGCLQWHRLCARTDRWGCDTEVARGCSDRV